MRKYDRATEVRQGCAGLKIEVVTLHSYRHAWAERALKCGYLERFAQQTLGTTPRRASRLLEPRRSDRLSLDHQEYHEPDYINWVTQRTTGDASIATRLLARFYIND